MSPKTITLSIALACSGALVSVTPHYVAAAVTSGSTNSASATAITKIKPADLTLEQVFRAKSYTGQQAKFLHFSHDGRYLAYAWNPFGELGADLYIYDTQTGTNKRITSPLVMKNYDAPEVWDRFDKKEKQKNKEEADRQAKAEAQAAYLRGENVNLKQWEDADLAQIKLELADKKTKEAAKKAEAEAEAAKEKAAQSASTTTATNVNDKKDDKKDDVKDAKGDAEKEIWELRDELKKKNDKEKLKPTDLYPGISNLVWGNKKSELIFEYRGDLFRLIADSGKIERLTQTDKTERIVAYNADDKGYIYMDEKSLYSASFDQSAIRQLNRELIHPDDADKKYKIVDTVLSENKQWMAISAEAPEINPETGKVNPPSERKVEIMDYNGRFATAKKVDREVADDKRKVLPTALYIRRVSDTNTRQPQPVFTNDGGDVWFEMSDISWAKDGSRYTFSTWEREKNLLRVYVGKADESAKPTMVLERRGNVGHEVVSVISPRFTPDSKQLIAILDEQGYRQPYVINTETGAAKPVLKGDFEAHHIVGFSPDSQFMFVLANKDDFAAMNAYKVEMTTGTMTALGKAGDYHRASTVADTGTELASVAGQWASRPELKIISTKTSKSKTLTQSNDPLWSAVDLMQPTRFSYPNRHGDTIQAYVFKPEGWKETDQRPAIVYTYGGPLGDRHIIETDSFQPTGYLFGMYMAAKHGYVTVAVDPRGHSDYGRKFSDANWEQPGKPQTEDLEDLARYMQQHFGVDGTRIGLTGWSFGGFQTQYAMYTSPDTFAAGIAGGGPTEWENYNSWYTGRTLGKTERNKLSLRRFSLLPLTAGLKKPLMLVHGMQDPNVLYQDTVNVYRALLENGKEQLVDLFLDPDGEHGMGGAIKAKAWHKKYETFFIQHLGEGNSAPK
ncbi:S9 family peptidase [Undibacterium sp. RuRC25W]|uniref:S9 family peptidase n=1 Tax=Undibacterium sp. RuRC25W TaxID=3413047 RepID=UPI003BF1CDA0